MEYKSNERKRVACSKKKVVVKCRLAYAKKKKIKDIEQDPNIVDIVDLTKNDCTLTIDQYKDIYKDFYKGLNYDWNQPLKVRNKVL